MGGFKRVNQRCWGALAGAVMLLAASLSGCLAEPLDPEEEALPDEPVAQEQAGDFGADVPPNGNETEQDEPTPIPWVNSVQQAEDSPGEMN